MSRKKNHRSKIIEALCIILVGVALYGMAMFYQMKFANNTRASEEFDAYYN